MGGDSRIYLEVLKEYFKENKDTIDLLNSAIGDNDYHNAAQLIHKVKGSSGSIGALKIHSLAKELQEALINFEADKISKLHNEFSAKFSKLLSQAGDYLIKMGNS